MSFYVKKGIHNQLMSVRITYNTYNLFTTTKNSLIQISSLIFNHFSNKLFTLISPLFQIDIQLKFNKIN